MRDRHSTGDHDVVGVRLPSGGAPARAGTVLLVTAASAAYALWLLSPDAVPLWEHSLLGVALGLVAVVLVIWLSTSRSRAECARRDATLTWIRDLHLCGTPYATLRPARPRAGAHLPGRAPARPAPVGTAIDDFLSATPGTPDLSADAPDLSADPAEVSPVEEGDEQALLRELVPDFDEMLPLGRALALHVTSLEATLEELTARADRLQEQYTADIEEVLHIERLRTATTLSALRPVLAAEPGDVALARVEAALARLGSTDPVPGPDPVDVLVRPVVATRGSVVPAPSLTAPVPSGGTVLPAAQPVEAAAPAAAPAAGPPETIADLTATAPADGPADAQADAQAPETERRPEAAAGTAPEPEVVLPVPPPMHPAPHPRRGRRRGLRRSVA